MKKVLAILTAVMMLMLFSATALAETVKFVEDSTDFDISMELPEGATVGEKDSSALVSVCEIKSEGLADVYITIAPSDLYGDESMNDLSDTDVADLEALAVEQYDDAQTSIEVTPSGNKYIHVTTDVGMGSIFTLYMGYFVELTQWHEDYSELTDADFAFMQQLLYNITFQPLQ